MEILGLEADYADQEHDEIVRFYPPDQKPEWGPVDQWGNREWHMWLGQHDGWDDARIDQYLNVDRYRFGVGLKRHPKEDYSWFYLPVPAAIPLHASKTLNVLYGGAAGGTKSHSTRWDAYRHCLAIPDYRSIITRRTLQELRRNHIDRARAECEQINRFYDKEVMQLHDTNHEINFRTTGSRIIFGHCQNLGDEEKYLGDEYDEYRPDEMATHLKQQIVGIAGRLRSVKHGNYGKIRGRLVGTSNPGGANTLWLKQWFIDRMVAKSENPRYNPDNYQFIGARLYDNPWLMDPDGSYTTYEDRLFAYSPQRRRQLLNGDWSAITGQFFSEFIADPMVVGSHVKAIEIPRGCKIERWIDWGYSPNPGVCHWVACFPDGRLYVFAEWVFNGEGRQLQVAAEVAKRIKHITFEQVLPQCKGLLGKTVADPSMWAKDGHSGESFEETFRKQGVRMQKADHDRIQGWGRYRHWLRMHPSGGRWLTYHPDCTYAIRTIPSLVHDRTNPDDCDSSGEDHAGDADRYGVMARPQPTTFTYSPTPTLPDSIAALLASERAALQHIRRPGQVS